MTRPLVALLLLASAHAQDGARPLTRTAAVDALVRLGRDALPALREAYLTAPDASVRKHVLESLDRHALELSEEDGPALAAALAREDAGIRVVAARLAARLPPPARAAVAAAAFADDEPRVARAALDALRYERVADPDALAPAAACLFRPEPGVRVAAARLLAIYGARAAPAAPWLARGLADPAAREACLAALAAIGCAPRLSPMLVRVAADPDEETSWRSAAVVALGHSCAGEPARDTLRRLLEGEEGRGLREESAEALHLLGDEAVFPRLLRSRAPTALRALAANPATVPQALDVCVEGRADPVTVGRRLAELGAHFDAADAILERWTPERLPRLVEVAGELGGVLPRLEPLLFAALDDARPEVLLPACGIARRWLSAGGRDALRSRVVPLLRHADAGVRAAALCALEGRMNAATLAHVVALFHDESSRVRGLAIAFAARPGEAPPPHGALLALLDERWRTRREAARALIRAGPHEDGFAEPPRPLGDALAWFRGAWGHLPEATAKREAAFAATVGNRVPADAVRPALRALPRERAHVLLMDALGARWWCTAAASAMTPELASPEAVAALCAAFRRVHDPMEKRACAAALARVDGQGAEAADVFREALRLGVPEALEPYLARGGDPGDVAAVLADALAKDPIGAGFAEAAAWRRRIVGALQRAGAVDEALRTLEAAIYER